MKLIQLFDNFLEKLSRWGIILCLFLILFLAVMSIILRWFGLSPSWTEPLVRHLVFLSTFFGGSLATSKGVHIKIDLLTHLVEKSSSKVLQWIHLNLVSLFCLLTTLALTKASFDFYLVEKEFGSKVFFNIHSSYLVGIIPFGMGLITLRFFNRFILNLTQGDARERYRL